MKIGVDLDSVLADILPPLVDFHNESYGSSLSLEDHIHYDLSKIWSCSSEEVIERLFAFYASSHMNRIQPIDGAKEGITYLSMHHELILVTSRPHHIESQTEEWLRLHFPGFFQHIHHSNQVSRKGSVHRKKSEICREMGVESMIEDCLDYAIDISSAHIPVYLLDNRWNQCKKLPKNVVRIFSWQEIKNYL